MRLYVVDAFTDTAFRGNPAAVVLLDEPADERWMQNVAAEMKHAETAFVVTTQEPKPLRWFTPTTEVSLCGHATLATAHVLGGSQTFTTASGELRCARSETGIDMRFPADPPAERADVDVSRALPSVPVTEVRRSDGFLLVVSDDTAAVRSCEPDFDVLAGLHPDSVIVTGPSDTDGVDFVSRMFAPAIGIPEDPVTGSAHCVLAPYWAGHLGRGELTGEQASPRGGIVRTRLEADHVVLSGTAVTILEGTLVG
ncbi:PhzF family phenazine biosynthesis protein [Prauserella halophila]|uniref:PhzF family phenazine biosynthesis protein n=1 Tax=Prauserella halophila TaxID=185641 RepID=A0ABN1W5U1_9PSEU|nr:PhzF family phenazine biosynthesis protein [Prauserella halophila]MCP2235644.1 phenazine biosynthesis protein PhzF family [Prauserella halophila]